VTFTPEGWYPDPSGAPGVNRWWTGSHWSEQTQIAPPPPPSSWLRPSEPHLASYGLRLGGWLLDFVIVTAISIPLLIPFGGLIHDNTTQTISANGSFTTHSVGVSVHGVGFLVHAILILLYGMLFVGSRRGQTPGMMIVGIRCVRADGDAAPIGYGKALLRAFVEYLLAVALLLPWVIDMLFPLWDGRKQTIHDKAAGSLVVDRLPPT
jgi:uncharacterized RDD family membrane protein YckC